MLVNSFLLLFCFQSFAAIVEGKAVAVDEWMWVKGLASISRHPSEGT